MDRKIKLGLKKTKEREKLSKEWRDAGEDVNSDEEEEPVREAFGTPQCKQEGCKFWRSVEDHRTQLLCSAH